ATLHALPRSVRGPQPEARLRSPDPDAARSRRGGPARPARDPQGLRQGVPAQPAAGAALRELRGGGGVLARGPGRMGLMRRLPALTPGLTLALGTALGLAACSDCGATPAPRRNQGSQGS